MSFRDRWHRWSSWAECNATSLYALTLTILLGMIALAPGIFIDVPAGHIGVLWLRFSGGTVTDQVYSEGMHFIAPWDKMAVYDIRLRNETRTYEAVAANGMSMSVDVAVRFRINPPAAGLLHKLAGPNYAETLVYPKIASLVYEFVSQHNPEDFYSVDRKDIQAFLIERARREFAAPPSDFDHAPDSYGAPLIRVEDVLVSGITLPPLVRQAIDRKIEQQQIMQEYDFRLAREAKERDRKRIEAEGIRDFQETVAHNITPEYLRLRGIEATKAFADSSNAKTIIIGGRDGLPVILNTGEDLTKTPSADASTVPAVAPSAIANPPAATPPNAKTAAPAH